MTDDNSELQRLRDIQQGIIDAMKILIDEALEAKIMNRDSLVNALDYQSAEYLKRKMAGAYGVAEQLRTFALDPSRAEARAKRQTQIEQLKTNPPAGSA